MTTKELNRVTKVMLKKANAMKELSESNLAEHDAKIDIEAMCKGECECECECEYIWMLRKYGTYLIKLSKDNVVYQFDLDYLKGRWSGLKLFYHIHEGLIEQIEEDEAIKLASEYIEK